MTDFLLSNKFNKVVSYKKNGEEVDVDGANVTLTFREGGNISASFPANGGSGKYSVTGATDLTITDLGVTERALCGVGEGTDEEKRRRAQFYMVLETEWSSLIVTSKGIIDEKSATITFSGSIINRTGESVEAQLILQKE